MAPQLFFRRLAASAATAARTAIPPLVRYQNAFQGLSQWFPILLYGFLGALSTYLMAYENMDIVSDRFRATYMDTQDTFDFIIVGAGSSGAVVANRLSENYNVLLLEAGGEPNPWTSVPGIAFILLSHPELDWNHKTVPQKKACFALPNRQSGWSQGRGLGGTSNLNFLIYLRGHKKDYDYWANITGDPQWSFNELLPYFKRAENYNGEWNDPRFHGQGGEMNIQQPPWRGMADLFVQAAQEKGYTKRDLNAPFEDEGFSQIYMPLRNGRRGGSFQAFLEPVRNRPSLTIYKFSHVNKILLRGSNNEAYGVEYERHGMAKVAYARKEVIISAGAIQSPKILMLSGIGPRRHLESLGIPVRADLPVGQNLQDHISTFLGPFFVNETISTILDREANAEAFMNFTRFGTGPLSAPGVNTAGFMTSSYAKNSSNPVERTWPDIQLIFLGTGVYKKMDTDFAHAFHVKESVMKAYLANAKGRDSFQIIVSLARPLSKGVIELASTNPKVPSLIDPKYLDYTNEVKILIEGIKAGIDISTNTPAMRRYDSKFTDARFPGCESYEFMSDEYWECYIRQYSITLHHIVGTCAMGKRDSKQAVVDTELRVIGTSRLRVIDASVMINVPISNTHASCVMIGEKGADLVRKTWERSAGGAGTRGQVQDDASNSIIR